MKSKMKDTQTVDEIIGLNCDANGQQIEHEPTQAEKTENLCAVLEKFIRGCKSAN